jgi:hypothetical protein
MRQGPENRSVVPTSLARPVSKSMFGFDLS